MIISFYGYNAFTIRTKDEFLSIDPGSDLYLFNFKTLIPEAQWKDITQILVTHGDPDHYWYADKMAEASGAPVICNKTMMRRIKGEELLLGPRSKGLRFTTWPGRVYTIGEKEELILDEMKITAIPAVHGPLTFKLGPFKKTFLPGKEERTGWGSIGFKIEVENRVIINLADTLLLEDQWKEIRNPDVLMIPIGGGEYRNTMNEEDALKAIKMIKPKLVIPCHYNCPDFFSRGKNRLDDRVFQKKVRELHTDCVLMNRGDTLNIQDYL